MPSAKNFSYGTVLTAPSPATTGTSLVLNSAQGALFPAVPFNATIWPVGLQPTSSNAEVVTVTAISTDTLTITRAVEGSSARTVIVGDQVAATITADVVTQSNRFTPVTAATQNITLDGSTDFTVQDVHEVGSGYSLEVPATSTLEPVAVAKQGETQSYFAFYDTIESGCVWTADSAGATLNGTMSDGYVWLNGRRLRVNAVRSRAFTASKDTYVDFSDAGNGTAAITYTETTNNLSTGSPTLAQGSLRNAIIVTAAGSIAASTSINQGQETMVVPIVSSIAYSVTDSLGNLICPRDPQRKILSYRQLVSSPTTTSTSYVQVTGLSCTVIVPNGRKIRITGACGSGTSTAAASSGVSIWDGVVASGTQIIDSGSNFFAGSGNTAFYVAGTTTPSTTPKTYNLGFKTSTGTLTFGSSATTPSYIQVELV